MRNLILQACETDQPFLHYKKTVAEEVPLSAIKQFLPAWALREIQKYHESSVSIWGLTQKESGLDNQTFIDIERGDLLLSHRPINQSWNIFAGGTVTCKWESREMGDRLWTPDEYRGSRYPFLLTLADVQKGSLPLAEINEKIGRPRYAGASGSQIHDVGIEFCMRVRERLSNSAIKFAAGPNAYFELIAEDAAAAGGDSNGVFVAYAREDEEALQELHRVTVPLIRDGTMKLVADTSFIRAGQQWDQEIKNAMRSVRVAVLLVSQSYLASFTLLYVLLTECLYERCGLKKFQAAHEPPPLDQLSQSQRSSVWVDIARKIEAAVAST